MRASSARAAIPIAVAVLLAVLLPATAQASDKYGFAFKEEFGSAAKPSFTGPEALAVDPASGDLLVADAGQNEEQLITFNNFAEGDKFTLTWTPPGGSAETTAEITFKPFVGSLPSGETTKKTEEALEARFGTGNFVADFGDNIRVTFTGAYRTTPVSLMHCVRVSGSGSCSVTRKQAGSPPALSRYKPNGEPDDFSALGTNKIDGREGPDETPQGALSLNGEQIAVDGACAEHEPPLTGSACTTFDPANGDIYVTQFSTKSVDVFSSSGEYLGRIDESTSNEIQELELTGFAEGDELSLGNLPGACSGSATAQVPYDPAFAEGLQAALEAQCGPDFSVRTAIGVNVEFTGELGDTDVPGLTCGVTAGPGTCSRYSTVIVPGDATHNEVQRLEFSGLAADSEFALGFAEFAGEPKLPNPPCGSSGEPVANSAGLVGDIRAWLEERCGANFNVSLSAAATARVTFANSLGLVDQPQLSCSVATGSGACAASTPEPGGQPKPLGGVQGLAVDPAGAVYVADRGNDEIHKFLPTAGTPYEAETVAGFPLEEPRELAAGAGPTEGSLFAQRNGEVVKLDSASGEPRYVVEPRGYSTGLSVNPADGALFAVSGEFEVIEYDASGSSEAVRLAHFGPYELVPSRGNIHGIAVDPATGDLYEASKENGEETGTVAVFEPVLRPEAVTEPADEIGGEEVTLHGKVSAAGGPPASCEFQYWPKSNSKETETVACSPAGPFSGSSLEAVSAHIEGLSPGTPYRFAVVAANKGGSTPEYAAEGALDFTSLGPAIAEQEVSEIGETEATVSAQLNPNEEQTTYAVEYVSQADYEASGYDEALVYPLPRRTQEAGSEFVHVAITLTGLPPASAWHARIAAANAVAVHGPDQSFATYPVATGPLDGRAYEMVTPSRKKGEAIAPNGGVLGSSCDECLPDQNGLSQPEQVAPDGESVLYEGQPFATGLASQANQYVSKRGPSSWDWRSLSPPTLTGRWQEFSADLSRGIVRQSEPPLSPEAPTGEGGRAFANLYLQEEGGAFKPLLTEAPPHRVPGIYGVSLIENQFHVRYSGANAGTESAPALSHVLLEANDALTPAVPGIAPKAPEVAASEEVSSCGGYEPCDLYEWSGGQLRLVNVFPGNSVAVSKSVIGSGNLLETGSNFAEVPVVANAISADGRIVFFSTELVGHVYARVDAQRTLAVPGPGTCKASVKEVRERACFLTASPDGHRVLLNNGQIDELNEEETSFSQTWDLSEGEGGFQGILGASEDLSRVYFVDTAALTSEAEANANGEHAEAGKYNLYAWREGSGASFIGRLAEADNAIGVNSGYGAWHPAPTDRTAQVTPDGGHLAFMSRVPLTGYDNTCTTFQGGGVQGYVSGRCFEVFEYAAASGKLVCVSCNPTGQPPVGRSNLSAPKSSAGSDNGLPQIHNLSPEGDGRLFFESADWLTTRAEHLIDPRTHNPIQSVYEYEPKGVGSCEEEGGCVQLLSSGKSTSPSMFLDSTPSGNDALFVTRSQLVASDKDDQMDLYDARVGGGFPEEPAPSPCEGEACKGSSPAAPGEAASAGSAAFAGPGNPPAAQPKPRCKKGKVRRRGHCVRKHRHRRRHHAKHRRKHRHGKRHARQRAAETSRGGRK